MSTSKPPTVDLVIVFRSSAAGTVQPRALARQNAQQASTQYARLHDTLQRGGLRTVGKRGEHPGQLLVFVVCPPALLHRLALRERHSDFLSGLPATHPLAAEDLDADGGAEEMMAPADRLRLVHAYMTATQADGGLGVAPGSAEWDRVESVMVLHDKLFNDTWIRAWTTRQLGLNVQIDKIKEQFGEAVALYFLFLQGYTKFLIFISAASVLFYFFGKPYSAVYSSILLLWAVTFVEWWRIKERILSVRWGTRGSFRVEKRRAQYQRITWWRRELRMLSSVPIIVLFAGVLVALLTGIFVFEAFVTQLYKGPGARLLAFTPTVLFVALVPRVMAIYHGYAVRFTDWENHAHQSTQDASLTIKTFSLSAIVAYGGLALSAFVYVPFGEDVMGWVQLHLFHHDSLIKSTAKTWATTMLSTFSAVPTAIAGEKNITDAVNGTSAHQLWEMDGANARSKLNPSRLQEQMFAITVTNQVINTFLEIGLPYVMRAVESYRAGKGFTGSKGTDARKNAGAGGNTKKRVMFEDETAAGAVAKDANIREERGFMDEVRRQVALPEYTLFADYSEMVTQFGYVALWSTIWPLASVMSLANNWLELRSDAFKIAVHVRRPIPARTDTIGPWLETLAFLAWLAALTNSALVYLFCPTDHCKSIGTTLQEHPHGPLGDGNGSDEAGQLLLSAAVIALAASHGYIILRTVVRHLLERLMWKGSVEAREAERLETAVKQEYLRSIGVADVAGGDMADSKVLRQNGEKNDGQAFWENDEGMDEFSKGMKEA